GGAAGWRGVADVAGPEPGRAEAAGGGGRRAGAFAAPTAAGPRGPGGPEVVGVGLDGPPPGAGGRGRPPRGGGAGARPAGPRRQAGDVGGAEPVAGAAVVLVARPGGAAHRSRAHPRGGSAIGQGEGRRYGVRPTPGVHAR